MAMVNIDGDKEDFFYGGGGKVFLIKSVGDVVLDGVDDVWPIVSWTSS